MGERLTRGLFAPAISYYKGTFYVTCTDIDHDGNFVATAKDPAGPWSDPVKIPQVRGIDPSIYFDEATDKAYILYNSDAPDRKPLYSGHRTIRMYEFDYKNLKVLGEEKQLVNGGVDISKKPVWIEAPHIMKRNELVLPLRRRRGYLRQPHRGGVQKQGRVGALRALRKQPDFNAERTTRRSGRIRLRRRDTRSLWKARMAKLTRFSWRYGPMKVTSTIQVGRHSLRPSSGKMSGPSSIPIARRSSTPILLISKK